MQLLQEFRKRFSEEIKQRQTLIIVVYNNQDYKLDYDDRFGLCFSIRVLKKEKQRFLKSNGLKNLICYEDEDETESIDFKLCKRIIQKGIVQHIRNVGYKNTYAECVKDMNDFSSTGAFRTPFY